MTKVILFVLLVVSLTNIWASSLAIVYVAQSALGSDTGTDAANAHGVTFFNTAGNWGSGASQIGSDTVVHLVGSFLGAGGSTMLTPHGTGTSGHPIIIQFDSGANLTAPYWGSMFTGALQITNVSYITIDGGANGTISATNNGTGLSNSNNSAGVYVSSASHIDIHNLTITNIYLNGGNSTNATDIAGQNTYDIYLNGPNDHIHIYSNTISGARSGIKCDFDGQTVDGLEIDHNLIVDHCWGISVGAGATNSAVNNLLIHDNELSYWDRWFYPGGANFPPDIYHTDGLILFTSGNSPVFAPQIYNNYIHGDLGNGSPTAFIFLTYGITAGQSVILTSGTIWNNLLVATNRNCWQIALGESTTNHLVCNNTLIGCDNQNGGIAIINGGKNSYFSNNIVSHYQRLMGTYSAFITNNVAGCDFNAYYDIGTIGGSPFYQNDGGAFFTYSQWKAFGYDAHTTTNNTLLSATYSPTLGSSVIDSGASLGAAFISDKMGTIRPQGSAWDIGAFEYVFGSVLSSAILRNAVLR